MKRILYTILYCITFVAVVSCSEDIVPEHNGVNPGDITLSIFGATPGTRAEVEGIPGVTALNENKINTIHYFFYPKNDTLSPPALVGRKGGYTKDDPALNAETEYSWTINVTDDKLKKILFPMPYNSCHVYMIVNLPESISDAMEDDSDYDMSLPNLKQIALEANFNSTDPQSSFVMEGLGKATIIDRKAIEAAQGEIEVERIAAKISVNISVEDQLSPADGETTTNGMTWISHPEDMEIELVNGVKTAVLGAAPTPVDKDNMFPTTPRRVTENNGVWSCAPFYSYPASWEVGAETEPYLRIRLPWTRLYTDANGETTSDGTPEYCIYKVILGGETLNRNTWYDLDIHIGILGGFENEPEVEIPLEDTHYFVADWSTGLSADASIEGARYLIVDKANYEVYNQAEVRIPFTSSHACEIVDMSSTPKKNQATVTRPDYTSESVNDNSTVTWDNKWSIQIDNNNIVFKHAMINDISNPSVDFTPYTINFIVRHIDDPNTSEKEDEIYCKEVTIKQYPAIYVVNYYNAGGDIWSNKERGYVMVNTLYNNRSDYSNSANGSWQTVEGFDSSSKNPNMYVITTTVLDSTLPYILCDSRESTYYGPRNIGDGFTAVKDVNERQLTYYYPTSTENENYLSPKFRISSAYGQLGDNKLTANQAKMRCAAYQEAGYPAGRWRLPTTAELKFIGLLCANGGLPMTLFGGSNYWSATNNYSFDDGIFTAANASTAYMRCVYDDWRWGSEPAVELDKYTWGDELN